MAEKPVVIALTGKGGVGKTSLSAAFVRCLVSRHPEAKILAVDADPAVGLSTALGVDVRDTLDEIRQRVAADVTGKVADTQDILAEARFRLTDAIMEQNGFAFLAIGRPEAAGCYCAVNTYLRQVIGMIAGDFDYVVIDGEAGLEQVNRRVLEKVTHLVFVSDQSRKGLKVVQTIKEVADRLVMYEHAGLIINRSPAPEMVDEKETGGVPLLTVIPEDKGLMMADVEGESVFSLPVDSPIITGTEKALRALNIE